MKKPLFALLACALVGLGVIVGRLNATTPASSSSYGPPRSLPIAQRQDARIQWEYKELQKNANEITTHEFDQLGNDGWEMCGVRQRGQGVSYFYFKREKFSNGNAAGCCEPVVPTSPVPATPPTLGKPIGTTGQIEDDTSKKDGGPPKYAPGFKQGGAIYNTF